MSISTIFEHGSCSLQVSASFKVSARVRNWTSSAHPPALSHLISKEFEVTKVSVDDFDYTEVATSGALTDGTYFIDRSGNTINELFVEARNLQDEISLPEYTEVPELNELIVGDLGETIPGDADTWAEYNGPMGLSGLYNPSELTDPQRNWWTYMTLQHFYHYVVNEGIDVYGYYQPYFFYTDISSTRSMIDAYNDEWNPGSYFDYTDWSTMQDDYGGIRWNSNGSNGWVMVVQYVSGVSGASTAVDMASKRQAYLFHTVKNFDSWNETGSTVDDLREDVTRVEFALGVAKHADITNDIYEGPRIISVPQIDKRIEPLFGKPIHRGAGTLVLNNADGYFDDLRDYNWAGNTCVITVKAKYPGDTTWGAVQEVGRYLMTDVTFSRDRVTVKVEEPTKFFDAGFPMRTFDDLESVNTYDENQGRHVPCIYGQVFGVKAYPVKKSSKEFQVADHSIYSISNVIRMVNGEPERAMIANTNYEAGRFTLVDWKDGQDVFCDVAGMVKGDGRLMNNPADIVEDILNIVDFADVNTTSIQNSCAYYDVADGFPHRIVDKEVGIYIDEPGKIGDIFEKINRACFSFFRFNLSNEIEYKAWYPTQRSNVTVEIQDHELIDFQEVNSERDIVTEIHANYQTNEESEKKHNHILITDGKSKYNLGGERVKVFDTRHATRNAAINWAHKLKTIQGSETKTYRITMPFRPIVWLPGDQIRLKVTRWGFNQIVEVLSVNADLISGKCTLVFSNRRNWGLTSGWYAPDSAQTYALLDTTEVKQSQWEEDGYYTDGNGFLNDQDSTSFEVTRYL